MNIITLDMGVGTSGGGGGGGCTIIIVHMFL